jgi:hypothetical protein
MGQRKGLGNWQKLRQLREQEAGTTAKPPGQTEWNHNYSSIFVTLLKFKEGVSAQPSSKREVGNGL